MMLIAAVCTVKADNIEEMELCTKCGYYHTDDDKCDEVKASQDGKFFNTNGAKRVNESKKLKLKDVKNIVALKGVHVTIIEGKENFVLYNGNAEVMKGMRVGYKKGTLTLNSTAGYRANEELADSSMCHVLICRQSKLPIQKITAKIGCKVYMTEKIKCDNLTVDLLLGSEAIISGKVKNLTCSAKDASKLIINGAMDSVAVTAETGSEINIVGKAKKVGCIASIKGVVNADVDCSRLTVATFFDGLVKASGKCGDLSVEATDRSTADLSDLVIGSTLYANAYNMSDIHVNEADIMSCIAENMGLVFIYKHKRGNHIYTTDGNGEKVKDMRVVRKALNESKF